MLYFLAKYKFPGVRNAVAHDMRREGGIFQRWEKREFGIGTQN